MVCPVEQRWSSLDLLDHPLLNSIDDFSFEIDESSYPVQLGIVKLMGLKDCKEYLDAITSSDLTQEDINEYYIRDLIANVLLWDEGLITVDLQTVHEYIEVESEGIEVALVSQSQVLNVVRILGDIKSTEKDRLYGLIYLQCAFNKEENVVIFLQACKDSIQLFQSLRRISTTLHLMVLRILQPLCKWLSTLDHFIISSFYLITEHQHDQEVLIFEWLTLVSQVSDLSKLVNLGLIPILESIENRQSKALAKAIWVRAVIEKEEQLFQKNVQFQGKDMIRQLEDILGDDSFIQRII
ncbi:hypothetical protein FGO68_gene1615 [Halteria grandinella]|uniref:Uncharacterized protein n=1 Tax=Halteria grandinella TaxID=5974 RepID=A0A8J8T174_HALGN|nr:hypothetical protein FGO68_gene1615 [Halteria grandinella]